MKLREMSVVKIENDDRYSEYLAENPWLTKFSGFAMFVRDCPAIVQEICGKQAKRVWHDVDYYAALEAFATDFEIELDGDRDVDDIAAEFCHINFDYFRRICKQFDLTPGKFSYFGGV